MENDISSQNERGSSSFPRYRHYGRRGYIDRRFGRRRRPQGEILYERKYQDHFNKHEHNESYQQNRVEYSNNISGVMFKQIQREYTKLTISDIRKIESHLAGVAEICKNTIMHNLCYREEAIRTFEQNELTKSNFTKNFQECIQFELEVHKKIINTYKVSECTLKDHSSECKGYHNEKDRRRKPLMYSNSNSIKPYIIGYWNYYPVKCKIEKCVLDDCIYAHNQCEVDYHPLSYKGTMCSYESHDGYTCTFLGERCFKAHSTNDLRNIPQIINKFKTNFRMEILKEAEESKVNEILSEFCLDTFRTLGCPNKEECNNKSCLYWHNILERRRNPKIHNYDNIMCSKTFNGEKYLDPTTCSNGDECGHCHTKNELYYHKENYRKKNCMRSKCAYGGFCPDIHAEFSNVEKYKRKINNLLKKNEDLKSKNVRSSVRIRMS